MNSYPIFHNWLGLVPLNMCPHSPFLTWLCAVSLDVFARLSGFVFWNHYILVWGPSSEFQINYHMLCMPCPDVLFCVVLIWLSCYCPWCSSLKSSLYWMFMQVLTRGCGSCVIFCINVCIHAGRCFIIYASYYQALHCQPLHFCPWISEGATGLTV